LADRLNDRPGQLSGGQRQRVALGRAIIRRPSLFLLDEPLSNLDAKLRTQMRAEIVQIQRRAARTMIYVTHDQAEALSMGDRIAIMNEGKIIQHGPPEALYRDPKNLFVAKFLGQPGINIIPGCVESGRLTPFDIDASDYWPAIGDRTVHIGIRPEAVTLDRSGARKGVVIRCEYFGDQYVAVLQVDNFQLTVSGLVSPVEIDQEVGITIDFSRALLFDPKNGDRLTY
jgi:multiple sugar transport system ATP-binding protein